MIEILKYIIVSILTLFVVLSVSYTVYYVVKVYNHMESL